jgi:hypothetical protein
MGRQGNVVKPLGTLGLTSHRQKAIHYREQAVHLRTLAEQDDNVETREGLLEIARTYDRLHIKHLSLAQPTSNSSAFKVP